MSRLQDCRGFGLPEVVLSIFIASVAIMALFSLQSPAWKATAQADLLGRASGIMHHQVENTQAYIMNVCNKAASAANGIPSMPVAVNDETTANYTVRSSGLGANVAGGGDAVFNVTTTIRGISSNYYRVRVTVTWPAKPTGITQTIFFSRQEYFRDGCAS